jgi:hypothetical protein
MPFKRISKNKYKSPSGRTFTDSQVKLYYSLGGTFRRDDHSKAARSTAQGKKGTDK